MKIAYILTWNLRHNDGVTRKVIRQVQTWRKLGHQVEIFCASELDGELSFPARVFRKCHIWRNPLGIFFNRQIYSNLCQEVRAFAPDIIYLRWEFHKNALARLMKDVPTVIELNTYFAGEFNRRAKENWVERLRYWYYKLTYKHFDRLCAGFIAVSKEILDKGAYHECCKPMSYIPNSIPIDCSSGPVPYNVTSNSIPRLVFISSGIQPWHGLENLLGLAEKTKGELEFDVITGFKPDATIIPENVRFHAFLEKEEFLKVFEGVVAGIGSAGLYENDMEEASVLKVREYLAAGLPVIIPYKDTAFIDQKLPDWVLELPNRAGGLAESKQIILDFVKAMNGLRIPPEKVAPYVGSAYWEARRMDFLEQVLAASSNR